MVLFIILTIVLFIPAAKFFADAITKLFTGKWLYDEHDEYDDEDEK